MTHDGPYTSPRAVESAIAEAARKAYSADPALTVQERIRLEYLNRFLSRVFSEHADSDWVLKGGTSMLARVASTRTTTDIDLFHSNRSLDAALRELRRLAAIDLGDFFRFNYLGHSEALDGNQQTYTRGYRVNFEVALGAKRKDQIHIDLVTNVVTTDDVELTPPANALPLPKLAHSPYRLYPVVDQIADKVCATIALYDGQPSSREKDLVDLVVLAVTQDVDAGKLRAALAAEAGARQLELPATFQIPSQWGPRYAKLASKVPACTTYRNTVTAMALMGAFIDPVLDGSASGKAWEHTTPAWQEC